MMHGEWFFLPVYGMTFVMQVSPQHDIPLNWRSIPSLTVTFWFFLFLQVNEYDHDDNKNVKGKIFS